MKNIKTTIKNKNSITKNEYKECIKYIKKHWPHLTSPSFKNQKIHIGLPNPFIIPSKDIYKSDQFYWDTYFIVLGLVVSGEIKLAQGMVDNLLFLFKKFGIVPMRNRFFNLGVSQLPLLTSMISEIYNATNDRLWLIKAIKIAEDEINTYWMDTKRAEVHLVYKGLSRYCDHHITHLTAEHESGWDMTSRFNNICLELLPVDLNSCLYKYEIDLSYFYGILGNKKKETYYNLRAKKRQKIISQLMWNDKKGFFFDYNYLSKKQSNFYSLAGFYPMWAGLATKEQAKKVKKHLKTFEHKGGLANTQSHRLLKEFRQWDYPNGWANQQWIVIKSLIDYGYLEDAERIAKNWLNLNKKIFEKTGLFWEKYNVVKCNVGRTGRYRTQSGFGWTNAIFVKLIDEFEKINKSNYKN